MIKPFKTYKFQFLYGTIISMSIASFHFKDENITIPLWYDYKERLSESVKPPVKFQFLYGTIISQIKVFEGCEALLSDKIKIEHKDAL